MVVYNAAMIAAGAPGPLERTVVELEKIDREAHFRRRHTAPARMALRNSDVLMTLIEESIEKEQSIATTWLWSAVTRIAALADSALRDELGIDRRPGHMAGILFRAQATLMQRAHIEAQPTLAPIIPLFSN